MLLLLIITRVCWAHLMKEKSEVSAIFIRFHKVEQNMFQSSIHIHISQNTFLIMVFFIKALTLTLLVIVL